MNKHTYTKNKYNYAQIQSGGTITANVIDLINFYLQNTARIDDFPTESELRIINDLTNVNNPVSPHKNASSILISLSSDEDVVQWFDIYSGEKHIGGMMKISNLNPSVIYVMYMDLSMPVGDKNRENNFYVDVAKFKEYLINKKNYMNKEIPPIYHKFNKTID